MTFPLRRGLRGLRNVCGCLRPDVIASLCRCTSLTRDNNEARREEHVEYTAIHSHSALASDALMRPQEAACTPVPRSAHWDTTFDFSPFSVCKLKRCSSSLRRVTYRASTRDTALVCSSIYDQHRRRTALAQHSTFPLSRTCMCSLVSLDLSKVKLT